MTSSSTPTNSYNAHTWLRTRIQLVVITRAGLALSIPVSALLLWFAWQLSQSPSVDVAIIPVTCAALAAIGVVLTTSLIAHLRDLVALFDKSNPRRRRTTFSFVRSRPLNATVKAVVDDTPAVLIGALPLRAQLHDVTSVEVVGDVASGVYAVRVGDGWVYSRRRNQSKPDTTE
jgi:hypothetical protein